MTHFQPADDLIHDISGNPNGRESLFWVLPVPEEQLLGLVYLWRDAHDGKWGRIVGVADRFGGEPAHLDIAGGLDLEGDDLDDCRAAGLELRQPDPLETAELAYETDGVALKCSVNALHEPFSWQDGPEGCPSWAADDRYEQSVRTKGAITIGERTVEFEGVGHRDHSWGTRDWRPLQHWKWMNAATPDGDLTFHGWISYALGDRQVNGYVNRGGAVSPIVEAEVRSELDHDQDLFHTSVEGRFATADGAELVWDATGVAGMPIHARHIQLNEVACTATLDGRPAVAHIEHGWPAAYIADFREPDGSRT